MNLIAAMPIGEAVEIIAPAFLVRESALRATELTFRLWPRTSPTGLDEDITRMLVYGTGQAPLRRVVRESVSIVPSSSMQANEDAMNVHRYAAERLSSAALGRITFRVDPAATTGVVVRTIVDPMDPTAVTGAGVRMEMQGQEVTGATIVFARVITSRSTGVLLHELGHVFGLGHTPHHMVDVMGPGPDALLDFSAREKLVMALMLDRHPGNRFPDNDRGVTGVSAFRRVTMTCDVFRDSH